MGAGKTLYMSTASQQFDTMSLSFDKPIVFPRVVRA